MCARSPGILDSRILTLTPLMQEAYHNNINSNLDEYMGTHE